MLVSLNTYEGQIISSTLPPPPLQSCTRKVRGWTDSLQWDGMHWRSLPHDLTVRRCSFLMSPTAIHLPVQVCVQS